MNLALPVAIFAGALIAVQLAIVGAFAERMHPFVASTWVHIGGVVFAVIGILIVPRFSFEIGAVRQAPWGLLAGVAGVILVASIAFAVGGLGLASTLAVVTGMQLLVGFGIETYGLVDRTVAIDPLRIAGALLIVAGVYLVVSRGPAAA